MSVAIRDCKLIKHFKQAMLVDVEGEEMWIPYSQIDDDSELYKGKDCPEGTEGTLVISDWLAEQRGLD